MPAATRGGQRNLFTIGAVPEVARPWTSYAPSVITLPDGSVKLSTKFTRLTGRSPILLAGMTPTTVDAKIVAAAANAGHWAELAGGGQVTEQIFSDRIDELSSLLEPGRAIQFNSLFLDPYLWKLQVGAKRLVQRARQYIGATAREVGVRSTLWCSAFLASSLARQASMIARSPGRGNLASLRRSVQS